MDGKAVSNIAFSFLFVESISGTAAVSNSLEMGGTGNAASNKATSLLFVISISGTLSNSDPVRK